MARALKISRAIILFALILFVIAGTVYYLISVPRNIDVFITSVPTNATVGEMINISWIVSASPQRIARTAVYYGQNNFSNPQLQHYANLKEAACDNSCQAPNEFSVTFAIDSPGVYYYRATVEIENKTFWSPEGILMVTNSKSPE